MNELQTTRLEKINNEEYKLVGDFNSYRSDFALLMPRIEGVSYIKGATESTVNTMHRCVTALRPNKSRVPFEEIHTGKTDDEVDETMQIIMKDLANLMQSMVHSASWRDGEFHHFDKREIKHKLQQISAWL